MESKTVMLINSVLMTTWILLDVKIKMVQKKKVWYFTDNHITVILTIYRECYDIKRNVGIVHFSFQPQALFRTSFVFERSLLLLTLTRAIIIYSMLCSSVACSSRASAA